MSTLGGSREQAPTTRTEDDRKGTTRPLSQAWSGPAAWDWGGEQGRAESPESNQASSAHSREGATNAPAR